MLKEAFVGLSSQDGVSVPLASNTDCTDHCVGSDVNIRHSCIRILVLETEASAGFSLLSKNTKKTNQAKQGQVKMRIELIAKIFSSPRLVEILQRTYLIEKSFLENC